MNPQKKLKGLAAILKHTLSLPTTEEVTSEEKVEREMRTHQDCPPVGVDVDPLEWWQSEQKSSKVPLYLWHKCLVRKII